MLTSNITLGRTKVLTRFEVFLRNVAAVVALLGAAVAAAIGTVVVALATGADQVLPTVTFRPVIGGEGPLIDPTGTSTAHLQLPIAVGWPTIDPWWPAAAIALVLTVAWVKWVVAPMLRNTAGENLRHRGLASARDIRRRYSKATVRRQWRHALPTSTARRRWLVGTGAMGLYLGRAKTPGKGGHLWVDLEQRVRIIARPGWGKTRRLLIPIIRQLHGPALISSTEPEIFTATVQARARRRTPGRFGRRHPVQDFPVAVVDCSPDHRITGGKYGTVKWNLIPGCENFVVATRRAEALVKGLDADTSPSVDSTSRWFEDGASKILAAWFHAAALNPTVELADLANWLATSTYSVPRRILQEHATDPAALTGMLKYLDPKGGRTTANLETSVARALYALTSIEGRAVCGLRDDTDQLDMADLIRAGGTLYLLAEPDRMRVIRPLLSLIASEIFLTAEDVARLSGGTAPAFYAVLDELRSGVRIATLPDVASEKRKFRIGYVYACTNGGDEEALYGETDAARLKAAAGTSVYGGLDPLSADDISARAGLTDVVTATRGSTGYRSETGQQYQTLTTSDLQQLADGESVIVGRDLLPFLAFTPALQEIGSMKRAVKREAAELANRPVTV